MERSTPIRFFYSSFWIAILLFAFQAHLASAAFPGANGKIVFTSNRDGDFEIYTINPDRSDIMRLTTNVGYDLEPAWSPSGTKIAFSRIYNTHNTGDIYVMNGNGSGQINITSSTDNWDDRYPTWSPDGTKIAFTSNRSGNYEIYSMNTDGSNVIRLTNTASSENQQPAWSPNGDKIAFVSLRDGNVELYVMNVDGNNQTNLTNTLAYNEDQAAWSPNGSKIAFRKMPTSGGAVDIFVMNSDGSGVTNLNAPAVDQEPAWSPNGSKIAFSSNLNFPMDVYVMNTDGSGAVNLTNNDAWDGDPDWQPLGGPTEPPPITLAEQAAELAKTVVGSPYLWGGKGWNYAVKKYATTETINEGYYRYWHPQYDAYGNFDSNGKKFDDAGRGLDCSGLVLWSYDRTFDINRIWTANNIIKYEGADGIFENNTKDLSPLETEPKIGDLLFFDGNADDVKDHVALYVGDRGDGYDVIEAPKPGLSIRWAKKDEMKTRASFRGFKRVNDARIEMMAKTDSPIDLIVTDPDGFTITPETIMLTENEMLREIPGELYYSISDIEENGSPVTAVYSPKLKQGNYIIRPVARPEANQGAVYGISFETGNGTVVIAENVPIAEIPEAGYRISVSEETITPYLPVVVDIKPESNDNIINKKSQGVVPVAVLGTQTFDVTQINPETLTLEGIVPTTRGRGMPMVSFEDVNADGSYDMVLFFNIQELDSDSTIMTLTGKLFDGSVIKGSDMVHWLIKKKRG